MFCGNEVPLLLLEHGREKLGWTGWHVVESKRWEGPMTFSGNNSATKTATPSIITESPQTDSKPRYPAGGFRFRAGFVGNEPRSWEGDVFTLHWAARFGIRVIILRLQLGQIRHRSRFGSGRRKMQEQMSEQQPGRPGLEELLFLPVMVLFGMGNYLGDV